MKVYTQEQLNLHIDNATQQASDTIEHLEAENAKLKEEVADLLSKLDAAAFEGGVYDMKVTKLKERIVEFENEIQGLHEDAAGIDL